MQLYFLNISVFTVVIHLEWTMILQIALSFIKSRFAEDVVILQRLKNDGKCAGFNLFPNPKFQNQFRVLKKTSICIEASSSFFIIACFYVRVAGQQLEIKPPHFTIFHHIHHFSWVNSQAILSKILNVIGPSSFRSSNWSSPICFGKRSLFGVPFRRHSAYMAKPSKLRSFNSKK